MANKLNNVFLIGPMGSGKTTIGKKLANKAEKKFYDSDWWKENVDIVRGHIAHREFKLIYSV